MKKGDFLPADGNLKDRKKEIFLNRVRYPSLIREGNMTFYLRLRKMN